jgi:hypothetical protein
LPPPPPPFDTVDLCLHRSFRQLLFAGVTDNSELEPTGMHPGRNGGLLRTGNPGNRGNPNGRTPRNHIPTKQRAGRALRRLLVDLEERLQAAKDGTGPKLSMRDAIAYARLCAEVEARDMPGDRLPQRIMVLSGSEADLRAAMQTPVVEARELNGGADEHALPSGDAGAGA